MISCFSLAAIKICSVQQWGKGVMAAITRRYLQTERHSKQLNKIKQNLL